MSTTTVQEHVRVIVLRAVDSYGPVGLDSVSRANIASYVVAGLLSAGLLRGDDDLGAGLRERCEAVLRDAVPHPVPCRFPDTHAWRNERDALRTRLAQVEGERDRLLHEAGNCPDDCALDHEPRTVRGMSCPAGCSARMIPDYVETHLTMCPAVQTALRAVIATLTTQIGEAWLEYEIANNGRRADAAAYEAHRRVCGR